MIQEHEDRINFRFGTTGVIYDREDAGFTIMCYAYSWDSPFDAYGLEERIKEGMIESNLADKIQYDSESGCFFAYTDSPKAVVKIISLMKEIIGIEYTEQDVLDFTEHNLIRLKHVTE